MNIVAKGILLTAAGVGASAMIATSAQSVVVRNLAQTEFRVSGRHERQGTRDFIWKLHADGVVTGIYSSPQIYRTGMYMEEGNDTGRWSGDANRLCIAWSRGQTVCYAVSYLRGSEVMLRDEATGATLTGQVNTLDR